jgi:hypothetical protein
MHISTCTQPSRVQHPICKSQTISLNRAFKKTNFRVKNRTSFGLYITFYLGSIYLHSFFGWSRDAYSLKLNPPACAEHIRIHASSARVAWWQLTCSALTTPTPSYRLGCPRPNIAGGRPLCKDYVIPVVIFFWPYL